ncbi:hypothetical protein NDN08_001168 [Rhodosorus marinus]|uniref:Altered inheritance of mitochondria protein 24, mitochondrial n=1 Tax=Rhodosorus marinus TaxID=101924 RepID=A0AAV8UQ25_9RHOD|nr:hypothetical protein NDN08_001168 [Rhodosorus marinus]
MLLSISRLSALASRVSFSHSSWFCVPDGGMTGYEVLARGTGFFTRSTRGDLVALFSAHVSAPFKWRKYFPEQEWLDHVEDRHCENRIALSQGQVLRVPQEEIVQVPQLDAAAYQLPTEDEKVVLNHGVKVLTLEDSVADEVFVCGYELIGGDCGSTTEDVTPTALRGAVVDTVGPRIFVRTEDGNTEFGMCGGPTVKGENHEKCIGLLEGRVPDPPAEAGRVPHGRAGQSALIPSSVLSKLINAL